MIKSSGHQAFNVLRSEAPIALSIKMRTHDGMKAKVMATQSPDVAKAIAEKLEGGKIEG